METKTQETMLDKIKDELNWAYLYKEEVKWTERYTRVSPEHKTPIVEALQANKEVIVMTGDEVNHPKIETQPGECRAEPDELITKAIKDGANGKAKSVNPSGKLCIDRSDFTNLKNYIFGSSAAIITNNSLIAGLG
jgi:hypothetical protein